MGLLVEDAWRDAWYATKSSGGRFVRKDSSFRNWITADGSAGPTGSDGFKTEAGAIISTLVSPVPGRTARRRAGWLLCKQSRDRRCDVTSCR